MKNSIARLLRVVFTCALSGAACSTFGATVTVTTAEGMGADTDIRGLNPDDQSDRNFGYKNNMSARHYTDRHEKAWFRFDLPDDIDTVTDARLELYWNQSWPVIISFQVFGLIEADDYGINGRTREDRLGEDWGELEVTWNNVPGNVDSPDDNEMNPTFSQLLYRFESPRNYDPQTIVTPPGTPTRKLIDFLNTDTNGMVTFMMRRPAGGDCMECVGYFAAKENTDPTTHPPRLALEYNPVPEPSTFVLLFMSGLGAVAHGLRRRL